jgi:hypothetical protein
MNAMRQAWAFMRLLFIGLLWGHAVPAWANPTPQEAQNAVDGLYDCFRDATRAITANEATVPFGPGSESFFFEQLAAATQSMGVMPNVAWCDTWFVAPYVRAHNALHSPQTDPVAHSPKQPLSTGAHWGSESRLLHMAARMGGISHVSAHADLMRHALGAPSVSRQLARLRLDMCARGLLIHAAQMPDLYLFEHALWHARSRMCVNAAGFQQACPADEDAFVQLVVQSVHRAQRVFTAGDLPGAMLLLGAVAHAVQDLSYHRGMTLAEQAGLTYVAHSNPDHPHGHEHERVVHQATQATVTLLAHALAAWPSGPRPPSEPIAEDHAALAALMGRLMPEAQPVTYATMRAYYGLSLSYGFGNGSANRGALARANQGRWSAPQTLDAIMGAL